MALLCVCACLRVVTWNDTDETYNTVLQCVRKASCY
jgi:hypothetical protein